MEQNLFKDAVNNSFVPDARSRKIPDNPNTNILLEYTMSGQRNC